MFPTFPNMTALVFFGIPSLVLIHVGRSILQAGDLIRSFAAGVALVACLLGAMGMLPAHGEHRCVQEWVGLSLSGIALCICLLRIRGGGWSTRVVTCVALYLTFAWGLLVTGCLRG